MTKMEKKKGGYEKDSFAVKTPYRGLAKDGVFGVCVDGGIRLTIHLLAEFNMIPEI
jgi:hypothetical protein